MFSVLTASDTSRGLRLSALILEEVATLDADFVTKVAIPLLNVSRRLPDGTTDPGEPQQAITYVTTSTDTSCYAYEKVCETLVMGCIKPNDYIYCSATYALPMRHGLFDKSTIDDIKLSTTFSSESFMSEYMSCWVRTNSDAWFNRDKLEKHRKYVRFETENKLMAGEKDRFYVIGVDVASSQANTAIAVFKVFPKGDHLQKFLVNMYTIHKEEIENQVLFLKKLYSEFKPRSIIIDATGLGLGFIERCTKETLDIKTGQIYPPLYTTGEKFQAMQPAGCEKVVTAFIATAGSNSEAHTNAFNETYSGHVDFLISEQQAKGKLLGTKQGQKMTPYERVKYLAPYEQTSKLFNEIGNLKLKGNTATNTLAVEKISSRLEKDRWSAFELGLLEIKQYEQEWIKRQKRNNRDMSKMILGNFTNRKNQRNKRGRR